MADEELPPDPEKGDASYEVGYGKPPKHSQFKTGNKHGKGRPRGSRNIKTYVLEALSARVPAKIGGKTRKLSKMELALHQLAKKAGSGDLKAIDQAVTLFQRSGPPVEEDSIPEEETAYALETLRHFLIMRGEISDE